MDAIKVLRQRAADKRDRAIKAARADFRNAVRLLDQLAQSVGPEPPPARRRNGPRPIMELMESVIPRDKPFTLGELVAALQAAEPDRAFHVPSVRTLMPDLVKAGAIRKVRRAAGGHVYWAHPECRVDDGPIAALSIADATALVLDECGPLTAAEIVVNLKERGYRTDADPRTLLTTLRYAFKRNREKFKRDEPTKKWSLA